MKFSFEQFKSLDLKTLFAKSPSFTLAQVLNGSWWVMLVMGLVLLGIDGFLFYQYGLGYAPILEAPNGSEGVRVREDTLKSAANAIRGHRAEFMGTTTMPADFPNPFR